MKKRREFSEKIRDLAMQRAKGCCNQCGLAFAGKQPVFDHIIPDALGGKPELANCQVLCIPCHKLKTAKEDIPRIRKADRTRRRNTSVCLPAKNPVQSAGFPKFEKARAIDKSALPQLARRKLYGAR